MYLDVYDTYGYKNRILGDATGEMGPFVTYTTESGKTYTANKWYNSLASVINAIGPWYHRGGVYSQGIRCGLFAFSNGTGKAADNYSFRIVLSP
jgi:hypothetical protein